MKSALLGVAAFALVSSASGCGIFGPDQSVVLGVSDVAAPASIAPNTSLTVALTVVSGGCKRFAHIETDRSASGANITVWGRDAAKGRNDILCTQDIRHEVRTVRFDPPFASTFTVTVDQGGHMPPHTVTVRVQ